MSVPLLFTLFLRVRRARSSSLWQDAPGTVAPLAWAAPRQRQPVPGARGGRLGALGQAGRRTPSPHPRGNSELSAARQVQSALPEHQAATLPLPR